MSCRNPEISEQILAYVDGVLPAEDADLFSAHVASCPWCRQEVEALGGLGARLRSAFRQQRAEPFDSLCPAPDDLIDLAAEAVTDSRRHALQAHLEICPACRDQLSLLRELEASPPSSAEPPLPSPLPPALREAVSAARSEAAAWAAARPGRFARWVASTRRAQAWAASLAVLVGLSLLLLANPGPLQQGPPTSSPPRAAAPKAKRSVPAPAPVARRPTVPSALSHPRVVASAPSRRASPIEPVPPPVGHPHAGVRRSPAPPPPPRSARPAIGKDAFRKPRSIVLAQKEARKAPHPPVEGAVRTASAPVETPLSASRRAEAESVGGAAGPTTSAPTLGAQAPSGAVAVDGVRPMEAAAKPSWDRRSGAGQAPRVIAGERGASNAAAPRLRQRALGTSDYVRSLERAAREAAASALGARRVDVSLVAIPATAAGPGDLHSLQVTVKVEGPLSPSDEAALRHAVLHVLPLQTSRGDRIQIQTR